jgi:hypothetical protein
LLSTLSVAIVNAQCDKNCQRAILEINSDGSTGQTIFDKQLAKRYPQLTAQQKQNYLIELKNNANFKGISFDGDLVEKTKTKLLPVLKLFKRENYSSIVIFKSNRPFLALYREFALVISTGMLDALTDEQLRGTAAHELAHECYIKEFEQSLLTNDFGTEQTVEHKCDLMAAMVSNLLNENPYSVVEGVEGLRRWLAANNIEIEINNSHPEPVARRQCVEEFFKTFQK